MDSTKESKKMKLVASSGLLEGSVEALIPLAIGGSRDALAELFVRFRGIGRRVLRVSGCPSDWVEEIEQDTFLKAERCVESLCDRGPTAFRSWYLRILVNLLRSRMRSELSRREWTRSYFALREAEYGTYLRDRLRDALPSASLSQAIDAVEIAMSQLKTADREIVTLRYIERMSGDDISAITGMRRSLIYKKAERALRKLRASCSLETSQGV